MSPGLRATITHITDRRLLLFTVSAAILGGVLVSVPGAVGVPGISEPVDVLYFVPLVVGTLMSCALPERLNWLTGPRSSRSRAVRLGTTLTADVIVGVACASASGAFGYGEMELVWPAVALVVGVGLLSASILGTYAWMVAAAFGSVMVVPIGGPGASPIAVSVPAGAGIAVVAAGIAVYAWCGFERRSGTWDG